MKNTKTKDILIAVGLSVISIIAIYYNAKPEIYLGYFLALFLIFVIGSYCGKYCGALLGLLITGAGLLLRKLFPMLENLKDKKLETFLAQNESYLAFFSQYFWAMMLLAVLVGFLGGLIGNTLKKDSERKISINRLSYMAFFVALSVIINTLRIGTVSFGGFPIILSGYFLGPISGFLVGAAADLLGFLVRPSAFAFNPLFTLTSALTGLIPVLTTHLLGGRYPKYSFVKVFIGIFTGQLITSVLLVPLFQVLLYGNKTFLYYLSSAALKQAVSIPLYAFLTLSLHDRLAKFLSFDKLK